MLRFICKSLLQRRVLDSNPTYSRHFHTFPFLNSISEISNSTDQQSLTVSYLINSCGLSSEQARSASEKIKIQNPRRPDSVLELLDTQGFTKTQIASLISKRPNLILLNPDKILGPKIKYFEALGMVGPELNKFICSNTDVLTASLTKRIIPNIDFLKGFVRTNENLVHVLRQWSYVVGRNIVRLLLPNISTLRAHGVPEDCIAKLIMMQPRSLMCRAELFEEVVNEVKEMGFQPLSRSFIFAIRSVATISREKWKNKKEILMSFGLSEDEFLSAFRVQPGIVGCSEKKLEKMMRFLLNEVGLKPSDVVRGPNLLLCSLEKRIIPRLSLLKFLMSKSMVKEDLDLVWALAKNKKVFEKMYVTPYEDDVPEVIRVYKDGTGV